MHALRLTQLLAITGALFSHNISANPHPERAPTFNFSMSKSEGGQLRKRSMQRFEKFMHDRHCSISISPFLNNPSTSSTTDFTTNSDIAFSAIPSLTTKELKELSYEVTNQVIIKDELPLTMTLMIKKSAEINEISSLQGERFAIVSNESYIGGKIAKTLLSNASVNLSQSDIYETGSYLGAMSMLLHGDVFFAAIPGPLARQWKDYNKLDIIAESSSFKLGTIYMKETLPEEIKLNCQRAFNDLKRDQHNKEMIVFPSWVEGFESVLSP